jgi:hypothetical protein
MIDVTYCTQEQLSELFSYYMDAVIEHPSNPSLKYMLNIVSDKILENNNFYNNTY